MKIDVHKHRLEFKRPAGTSRSVLLHNDVWFIRIEDKGKIAYGECNPLVGLSLDDLPDYERRLKAFADEFEGRGEIDLDLLNNLPSMKFGFESALKGLEEEEDFILFPSEFTDSRAAININGLLWMGSREYMMEQLEQKIKAGFNCIKMKIGAIDFEEELSILKHIRSRFTSNEIELRVDANGAFKAEEAMEKLLRLSEYVIHSIEQPIAVGQWDQMAELALNSPIPIALDEELIPLRDREMREKMMKHIRPQYIILKPSLIGGFRDSDQWIALADENESGWWLTSALESNVGLNAIAQYTYTKKVTMPQGLGTGSLYTNNIDSPLLIEGGKLLYDRSQKWQHDLGF